MYTERHATKTLKFNHCESNRLYIDHFNFKGVFGTEFHKN